MTDQNFRTRVVDMVSQIPVGKVVSYGQIAALCGSPRAARIVGGIAHYGDTNLPWHRVVKQDGGLAEGYPGGVSGHKLHLEAEGVAVDETFHVNMKEARWQTSL
jgi:methylated-DNA-protein-cysteine methyltransferase-like protein